ncbi:MAG: glycosyltransferase [Patulibacter minatonensis]
MTAARPTVSVLLPVKNGGPLLEEVLAAVAAQHPHELIVTDSGSTDGSVEVARRHGARVIEIPPAEFKHGPTRNVLAEASTGDVLAYLTQDATPIEGWLDAIADAFAADPDLGVLFGPHLPREDTSPMIARELTEYFGTLLGEGGSARTYGPADPIFLSNVDAAYRRACWAEIRFADLAYSEDQAFGRAIAEHPRWTKRIDPAAAVLHAHDFPPGEFFKRYFDEYRGIRETVDHVEQLGPKAFARQVRNGLRSDLRYVRAEGVAGGAAKWAWPIARHHALRHVGAGLGGRAARIPAPVERRLSLEGRASDHRLRERPADAAEPPAAMPHVQELPLADVETTGAVKYAAIGAVDRLGPAPLTGDAAGRADRERLHLAFVIPPFRIGSGGHMSIFRLVEFLESQGHVCTIWVDDPVTGPIDPPAVMRRTIVDHFRPIKAPVFAGLDAWYGADVAVATAWTTVDPVLRLPKCASRAYLVHDDEREFYAASAEQLFAENTFGHGLHAVCSSPWLQELAVQRGATADLFDFGVEHDIYAPSASPRRANRVAFYARHETARRGVDLGVLALEQVLAARPDTEIVQFGTHKPPRFTRPTKSLGVASPAQLAELYSTSALGLCLSFTNYSLIPKEMLACGLPCVDLPHPSATGVFGEDGPVVFADRTPHAIAEVVIGLLDDAERRARLGAAGARFVADLTWEHAGAQVEHGLRNALRLAGGRSQLPAEGAVRVKAAGLQ